MQNLLITAGNYVKVRRERWRIASIRPYENCRLLDLHGIGPRNRGIRKHVLLPFEIVEPVQVNRRPRYAGSRRWQQQCRGVIASVGGADALRSAEIAKMDLLPHQLEPALAMVRGDTSRILIADDVGLGKTIQAGLIAAELLVRGAAERVLILTPAGLREQWIGELRARFDLSFTLADTVALQHRPAMIRPGINPWSTIPLVVASLDYVKRPEVLPAVERCRWDLVIVDEAHGATIAGDRHAAVTRLAARAPYVLLLTATPHNGDADAFAALQAIGRLRDPLQVFRRTRGDIGMAVDRRIHRLSVQPTGAEREMHARLEQFSAAVLADHDERSSDVSLALSIIHKRALSSAFALLQTVNRRLLSLAGDHQPFELQLTLPLDPEPGEHDHEDGIPRWTCPALHDRGAERTMLAAIAEAATAALDAQAKLRVLRRMIRRMREPVVVFTEYRDTLLHVREHLLPDAAVIHGGLSRLERQAALQAFECGERTVLLATDAAGEGLNLHRTCRAVINLELPWNPMRLEQRIGRVDRIGQRRRVHAVHLVAAGTRESTIVARLHRRLDRARHDIGVPDPLGTFAEPSAPELPPVSVDVTREHQRLVEARRLTGSFRGRDGTALECLFTIARPRLRRRIAPRTLAVVRHTLTDGIGRPIAHHITGLLLALRHLPGRQARVEMRQLLKEIDARVPPRTFGSDDHWDRQAAAVHVAFWRRRVQRERTILHGLMQQSAVPHQPGLFTRHAIDLATTPGDPAADGNPSAYLEAAERCASLRSAPINAIVLIAF